MMRGDLVHRLLPRFLGPFTFELLRQQFGEQSHQFPLRFGFYLVWSHALPEPQHGLSGQVHGFGLQMDIPFDWSQSIGWRVRRAGS